MQEAILSALQVLKQNRDNPKVTADTLDILASLGADPSQCSLLIAPACPPAASRDDWDRGLFISSGMNPRINEQHAGTRFFACCVMLS